MKQCFIRAIIKEDNFVRPFAMSKLFLLCAILLIGFCGLRRTRKPLRRQKPDDDCDGGGDGDGVSRGNNDL